MADQKDIQTHVLNPPLATGGNAASSFNLGYAALEPTPPTVMNARLITTPGHGGLMAPQDPTNPNGSKALIEWCNGFGVVYGVLDQTTILPFTPVPGDSWLVSTLTPSVFVWCDSSGNLHLSAAADVPITTATFATTINALIQTINGLITQQTALLAILEAFAVVPSTGIVNPATITALQANAQTVPQVIT